MDAANVLKTELLSLEGASIEQKFMLMLVERIEACEERIKHDARAPSHSFNARNQQNTECISTRRCGKSHLNLKAQPLLNT